MNPEIIISASCVAQMLFSLLKDGMIETPTVVSELSSASFVAVKRFERHLSFFPLQLVLPAVAFIYSLIFISLSLILLLCWCVQD